MLLQLFELFNLQYLLWANWLQIWKTAYADGEAKLLKFLEERVFTKVKSLFDSVPKNKSLIFANEKKETSTSGKDKVTPVIMERVSVAAILETVQKSSHVN